MSSAAVYTKGASYFHWMVALPLTGCIATVMQAQDAPKEQKGELMFRHKSLGLLTGLIVAPRLAYRIVNRVKYNIPKVEGSGPMEHTIGNLTHYGLYAFMTIMPATGIAMGYFGGKGLPFFATTIPGAATPNGAIAKNSFKIHKQLGTYGKFLVPAHIAGAFQHYFRGHVIFSRINPFRGPPKH